MPADSSTTAAQRGVAINGDVSQAPIVTGDHNVLNITYQGIPVSIPSTEAIRAHRAALRCKLENDAQQRWGGMGAYIQEEGARLPIEASPYQPGLDHQREDLMKHLANANRLIVLGEPGSGKTVAVQRFAWELCDTAGATTIPVIIPLLFYAGTPLNEWVRSILQNTGLLRLDDERALTAFLHQPDIRCVFLLDGLNEVSPVHRDRLKDELVRWQAAQPRHSVIITSRAQDEVWRSLHQQIDEALVIQPITGAQVTAYLTATLGEVRGLALCNRLDDRLRTLVQRPLLLYLMKEAALADESLPGNRGELYARFVSRLLARDTDKPGVESLPDHVKRQAAMRLAYELHARTTLVCPRAEAAAIVTAGSGQAIEGEAIITTLLRHGLLLGDEQLRFPHQTLQEYFVAEALREQVKREQARGDLTRWWHTVRPQTHDLAARAADDWWSEAIIQLAGLIEDPAWLARTLARVNPWLAWWCVAEGRMVDAETRTVIEERSIKLLKSERVSDRLRAAKALSRIQSERVIDLLFQVVLDNDVEVAYLAVQSLMQLSEVVRSRVINALAPSHGPSNRPLPPGVTAYAVRLAETDPAIGRLLEQHISDALRQPIVYVPPGPFLMGSNPSKDKMAFEDESPQHEIILAGYFIGRYPVTVAQFRSFVTASGYRSKDQSSLKGEDTNPVVNVTWDDALAYCRWLSEHSGLRVTLPGEAEWEKAARGTDGWIYPWGNEFDKSKCNSSAGGKGGTTPVGSYSPQGDSPYGAADMAGNVWEWTRSQFKPYPYAAGDGRENLEAKGTRVLRGGAFNYDEGDVRCASRIRFNPNARNDLIGFRLASDASVVLRL